jgi:hypothetical protein
MKEFAVDISRATKDLQTLACDLSGIDFPQLISDENTKLDFLYKQYSISTMLAEAPNKISYGLFWIEFHGEYLVNKLNKGPEELEEYMHMAERYSARIAKFEALVCETAKKLEEPNPDIYALHAMLEEELDCLENASTIAFLAMKFASEGHGGLKLLEKRKSAFLSKFDPELRKEVDEDDLWFDYKEIYSKDPEVRSRAYREILQNHHLYWD